MKTEDGFEDVGEALAELAAIVFPMSFGFECFLLSSMPHTSLDLVRVCYLQVQETSCDAYQEEQTRNYVW